LADIVAALNGVVVMHRSHLHHYCPNKLIGTGYALLLVWTISSYVFDVPTKTLAFYSSTVTFHRKTTRNVNVSQLVSLNFRRSAGKMKKGSHNSSHPQSSTPRTTIGTTMLEKPSSTNDVEETVLVDKSTNSNTWLLPLVLPLWLVYISNQWSRSSIYYLVDFNVATADAFKAMNVAIGFSEAQYGLLASLAFTALFALASLGAGVAADTYNRKTLTILAAAGWSLATIGTALSTSYGQVLSWRISMGLFCAFSTPAAYTMINEQVPSEKTSLATSIYGTGVALGGALAALSILLDNQVGWQQALLVIGGVGLASTVIVWMFLPGDSKTDLDRSLSSSSKQQRCQLPFGWPFPRPCRPIEQDGSFWGVSCDSRLDFVSVCGQHRTFE
jgi:hypothetical protein